MTKKKKTQQTQQTQPKKTLSEMMAMPEEEMGEMEVIEPVSPVEPIEPPVPMESSTDTNLPPEVSSLPESQPDEDETEVDEYGLKVKDEPDEFNTFEEDNDIHAQLEELGQELGIEPSAPVAPPIESGTTAWETALCRNIRDYCTEHSIALILKALCEDVPEAMPNYRTWNCPDPIPTIYGKIHSPGYVEGLLGTLNIMMGSNVKNIQWAARVVIAIASYDVVREL